MKSMLGAPTIAQLELTEGCNHRCVHCYNSFAHSPKNMSGDKIKKVIDQLLSNEVFSVVLTGGEPFVNRDGLYFALDKLRTEPIDTFLNTNLSLPIIEEDLKLLKVPKFILISFLSSKEVIFNEIVGANSYKKVLGNLEKLAERGIPFGINQVVTQKNKYEVYNTGRFLFETVGARTFSASPAVPSKIENVKDSLRIEEIIGVGKELLRLESDYPIKTDMLECIPPCLFPKEMRGHSMAHHYCSAGKDMIAISVNGDVKRCPKLNISYGNIFTEELKTIWGRITEVQKPTRLACNDCVSAESCYSGCEARVLFGSGEDNLVCGAKDPFEGVPMKEMVTGVKYKLPIVRFRKEGDSLLISGSEAGLVRGNEMLLSFMQELERQPFNLEDARNKFGDDAEPILNYLYNRGLVRDGI